MLEQMLTRSEVIVSAAILSLSLGLRCCKKNQKFLILNLYSAALILSAEHQLVYERYVIVMKTSIFKSLSLLGSRTPFDSGKLSPVRGVVERVRLPSEELSPV